MENKCIGYIRISSTAVKKGKLRIEGENNSLEVQTKRIEEYCKYKGLDLVEIIQDKDVSGGTEFEKREGGMKAVEYFNQGIKTIVGIKIDRFFRNVADSLITIDKWNNKNIGLHIIEMGGASFNTKTATGRLIFTLMVANSEYERGVTGERTKAVLGNRKDTGKSYTGSILGYDNIEGKMVPNPDELAIIEIVQVNAKTMSPAKIAEGLNNWGYTAKKGGKFFPSTIQNILKNPIYNS